MLAADVAIARLLGHRSKAQEAGEQARPSSLSGLQVCGKPEHSHDHGEAIYDQGLEGSVLRAGVWGEERVVEHEGKPVNDKRHVA